MHKKLILTTTLLMSVFPLFSQEVQRITFVDVGPTGSQRINRTVNAIFAGWLQMEMRQEGNLRAVYMSMRLVDGEWTDWELYERRPMQGTLSWQFDALRREYATLPNAGAVMSIPGGFTILRMMAIPTGQTIPFWWGTSGNSFYVFHRLYMVVP